MLLGTVGQGVQLVPHEVMSVSRRHWFPQRWRSTPQRKSQLAPLQTAVALAGVAHGRQAPPQKSVLGLQAVKQPFAVQVAVPFGSD